MNTTDLRKLQTKLVAVHRRAQRASVRGSTKDSMAAVRASTDLHRRPKVINSKIRKVQGRFMNACENGHAKMAQEDLSTDNEV